MGIENGRLLGAESGRPTKVLCFGRAHAVPTGGVGGCYIEGVLSGT